LLRLFKFLYSTLSKHSKINQSHHFDNYENIKNLF
jgi:hypothetical protein